MWKLGKMGEFAVSPDGSRVVYANTYYDIEQNKGNAELYLIPVEGDSVKVCKGSHCEYGIVKDKMPGNLGTHILWEYVRE